MSSLRTYLTRHPDDPVGTEPALLQDFKELNQMSKRTSVRKAIHMIDDLRKNGLQSRFVKHLGGPLFELKGRTGEGGVRVYFFPVGRDAFALGRAESKVEDLADEMLLGWVAEVFEAHQEGISVLV